MEISANSAVFVNSKLRSCVHTGQTRLAATYADCRRRAASFAAAVIVYVALFGAGRGESGNVSVVES